MAARPGMMELGLGLVAPGSVYEGAFCKISLKVKQCTYMMNIMEYINGNVSMEMWTYQVNFFLTWT